MKTLKEHILEEFGGETKEDADSNIQLAISVLEIVELWANDEKKEPAQIQAIQRTKSFLESIEMEDDDEEQEEEEETES